MIINLEGIDGSGKTSLGKALAQEIGAEYLHFPNDEGYTGPTLRGYLRGQWAVTAQDGMGDSYGALAFQALQVVNRLEQQDYFRQFFGHADKHIVLDRYWASGVVYGQLDGLPKDWLFEIQDSLVPADHNILLRCNPEVALARMQLRGSVEKYEQLPSLEKVATLYEDLWEQERWEVVDANQSLENVLQQTLEVLRGNAQKEAV